MGYSKDFKDKVIEIMARDKMSVRKAAQHFNVCIQTIQNWKKSTVTKPIRMLNNILMIILVNGLSVLVSVHMQYLMRCMLQEYHVKKRR